LEADRDRINVRKDTDLWIDVLAARRLVAEEEGPEVSELLRRGQELGMWSSSPIKEYVRGLLSAFTSSI
jgi:hypothetical protein